LSRPDRSLSDDCDATKDPSTCSVRDYRADTRSRWGLDQSRGIVAGEQSLSKQTPWLDTPIDPPVRSDRGFLGQTAGTG
jgi:hypothetical protein